MAITSMKTLMEIKTMKTNKNLFLILTLVITAFAQPAHGMATQKSLEATNKILNKIPKYWKPVLGTLTVVAGFYWLWSSYFENAAYLDMGNITESNQTIENDINAAIEAKIKKFKSTFPSPTSVVHTTNTPTPILSESTPQEILITKPAEKLNKEISVVTIIAPESENNPKEQSFTPNAHEALVYSHYLNLKVLIATPTFNKKTVEQQKLAEIQEYIDRLSPELLKEVIEYSPVLKDDSLAQSVKGSSLETLFAKKLASKKTTTEEESNKRIKAALQKHLRPLRDSELDKKYDTMVNKSLNRLKLLRNCLGDIKK